MPCPCAQVEISYNNLLFLFFETLFFFNKKSLFFDILLRMVAEGI